MKRSTIPSLAAMMALAVSSDIPTQTPNIRRCPVCGKTIVGNDLFCSVPHRKEWMGQRRGKQRNTWLGRKSKIRRKKSG